MLRGSEPERNFRRPATGQSFKLQELVVIKSLFYRTWLQCSTLYIFPLNICIWARTFKRWAKLPGVSITRRFTNLRLLSEHLKGHHLMEIGHFIPRLGSPIPPSWSILYTIFLKSLSIFFNWTSIDRSSVTRSVNRALEFLGAKRRGGGGILQTLDIFFIAQTQNEITSKNISQRTKLDAMLCTLAFEHRITAVLDVSKARVNHKPKFRSEFLEKSFMYRV